MKKKNLLIIAILMVGAVTLSSWRLSGKENIGYGFKGSPDDGECYELGFEDKYFFGFRVSNDVPVTRKVNCKDNSIIEGPRQ
jgi:hypothetical protein